MKIEMPPLKLSLQ